MHIRVCVRAQVESETVEQAVAHDGKNCLYKSVPTTALCLLEFWELPGQVNKDLQEGVLVVATISKPEFKCEC